jgi:hypothetical protein
VKLSLFEYLLLVILMMFCQLALVALGVKYPIRIKTMEVKQKLMSEILERYSPIGE